MWRWMRSSMTTGWFGQFEFEPAFRHELHGRFASLRVGGASNKPGVARRQLTFFLRRQKESKQRKRRPEGPGPSASRQATSGACMEEELGQRDTAVHRPSPTGWGRKPIPDTHTEFNPECRKRKALPARESQRTVMFARERSARGHMKSPSLAQRGEGGARGGSGEFSPAVCYRPGAEVCPRLLAGGCPAATHFLLLRQKKVSKEKATLLSASPLRWRCEGQPAVLGPAGVELELAFGSDNRSP